MTSNWRWLFLGGGWIMLIALAGLIYAANAESLRWFLTSVGAMGCSFAMCTYADIRERRIERFQK
jgi:hypothetical protein